MKLNSFYKLSFLTITCLAAFGYSCNKPYQPAGIHKYERPVSDYLDYLAKTNSKYKPTVGPDHEGSREVAYSFSSSKPGIITKLGVMLPDSGKTFVVSLWDSTTEDLLVQKNIRILDPNAFNYADLLPTNEFQVIFPNHTYLVGVFTGSVNEHHEEPGDEYNLLGDFYNTLYEKDNIFPFAAYPHIINFHQEYHQYANTPTFPKYRWPFEYVLYGFCDIEFTYVQPFYTIKK